MAEVLLKAVLGKFAEFSVGKLMSFNSIRDDVESLGRELEYIQGCILDADKKCIVDQTQKIWVRDLMDIAYQIENAVEIFLLEFPERLPGIMNNLKERTKDITKIPFLWDFQKEIERIRKRIKEIKEFKENYIITLGEEIPEFNSEVKLDPIDNPDVVGFDEDRVQIVNHLLDDKIEYLAIVSIVGIGGLGKTTLALKVFNSDEVIKRFGKSIWITISQKYELLHVLRTLARKLGIDSTGKKEHDLNELAELICDSLSKREKPYLIVLDDVWTAELWNELAKVLPDTKKGSRVLVTTRDENIINMAGVRDAAHIYEPYKPPFLSEEDSVELLLKKAIPRNRQCPNPNFNYKDLAKQFAKKCGYLPLALVVLGGLLRATQPFDFHAWNELLETMTWEDNECTEIIATSYKHLPLAKKWCFLYLAAYPEDTKIDVERLLRIWVADGLIPDDKKNTLEQTAASFLKDLAQRSMVQVVQSHCDGSVKYCRVHDILRDLAVREAEENNFLKVCSKPDDWKYCKAHRLAIHYLDVAELVDINTTSTVRSLLLFGNSSELDCSKYSVLRVLGMEGYVLDMNFEGSRHLRYLQLDTTIHPYNSDQFWKWVKSMNYLETLDLQKLTYAKSNPDRDHSLFTKYVCSIRGIKTLRHLLLPEAGFPAPGPPASVDLMKLQTFKNVNYNELWEEQSGLPNIPQLRELQIDISSGESRKKAETLTRLLQMLNHLICLKMSGDCHVLEKVVLHNKKLKFLSLQSLYRDNTIFVLHDGLFPSYLLELCLLFLNFESDPMPVLEKLGSLKILSIRNNRKGNHKAMRIRCSNGGFKRLEQLDIDYIMLEKWEIEIGAMPMLKCLRVHYCDPLPPPADELIQLPSLRYIIWNTGIEENKNSISQIFMKRPDLKSHWVSKALFSSIRML